MKIVTITLNPCIDKTLTVDLVAPNRKLAVKEPTLFPGGGGLNVARTIHELGGDVLALWSAGGRTAEELGRLLDVEGVPHVPVPIHDETRENVIIAETSSHRHFRFGLPGPDLGKEDRFEWTRTLQSVVPESGYVVFSGSLPPGASDAWFGELLGELPDGVRVVVDTKGPALARAIERGVFSIKPNVRELSQLVDRELEDDEAIEVACRELVDDKSVQAVVVSLGQAGALLIDAEGARRFAASYVPIRSHIGAGDSLVGGIVYALAQGRTLREAVELGVASGSATVRNEGTRLCRREDVEQLHARSASR